LLENCDEEDRLQLLSGYKTITDPEGMGGKFKFFAIFPAVYRSILEKYPAAGFTELDDSNKE